MAEGQVALYLIFTQVHLPPKEVKRKVLQQKKKKKLHQEYCNRIFLWVNSN